MPRRKAQKESRHAVVAGVPVTVWLREEKGRACYVDYYLPTGFRRRLSTGEREWSEGLKFLDALIDGGHLEQDVRRCLREEAQRVPVDSGDPRIEEVTRYYLDTALVVKNARPRSRERAVPILMAFEGYCRSRHIGRVSQLSRRIVDEWAVELAKAQAPATVRLSLQTLRAALNAAQHAGLFDVAPIERWLLPKVDQPEVRPLTGKQVRERLEAMQRYEAALYPPVHWIAHTGNRPGEVRLLKWFQIDMKNQSVERQQKARHLARYQFSNEARKALDMVKGDHSEWVFVDVNTGEPYEKKRLNRAWKRAQQKANLKPEATLYDLRDTFASIMANDVGCPLPVLQQLMGHSTVEMTMKYVKPGNAGDWLHLFVNNLDVQGTE